MAENIDLAGTFAAIGGTTLHGDGHSLALILEGRKPRNWRNAVLVEDHGPAGPYDDPDAEPPASGNPGPYNAIRSDAFLYVEYTAARTAGQVDFYNLRQDPYELHNLAGRLTSRQRTRLHAALNALTRCHGETACWAAMRVPCRNGEEWLGDTIGGVGSSFAIVTEAITNCLLAGAGALPKFSVVGAMIPSPTLSSRAQHPSPCIGRVYTRPRSRL